MRKIFTFFFLPMNELALQGLLRKLYREFMIMGFVSFAIFLASEASNFPHDDWYGDEILSFEIIFLLSYILL